MKRLAAVSIAAVLILALTGCGETWEELAQNKERCEKLGGEFQQWLDGFNNPYSYCNFDEQKEEK